MDGWAGESPHEIVNQYMLCLILMGATNELMEHGKITEKQMELLAVGKAQMQPWQKDVHLRKIEKASQRLIEAGFETIRSVSTSSSSGNSQWPSKIKLGKVRKLPELQPNMLKVTVESTMSGWLTMNDEELTLHALTAAVKARRSRSRASRLRWSSTGPIGFGCPRWALGRRRGQACIDQNAIESSLLCLPVYLASCKQLLICAGDTYTGRLWCVMGKYM